MITLDQFIGPQTPAEIPQPPAPQTPSLFLVQICPTVTDAVALALQCRKTHPEEPIEIWPAKQESNPKRVVLRERVTN
nr:hypothetical protein [uncultured Methanoregula sp.]